MHLRSLFRLPHVRQELLKLLLWRFQLNFSENAPNRDRVSKPSEVADAGLASFIVEAGHVALDGLGLIPGVGVVADLANAGLYAYEGRNTEAAWSLAAAIPGLGYAANTAKYAGKAGKLYQATRAIDVGVNLAESGYNVQQGLANRSVVQAGLGLFGLGANARAAAGLAGDGARALRNYEITVNRGSVYLGTFGGGLPNVRVRRLAVEEAVETGVLSSRKRLITAGEQVNLNREAGDLRELAEIADLHKRYPGATILRRKTLFDANRQRVIDPRDKVGRELDLVVVQNGRAVDVVEVTGHGVPKAKQLARERRIRASGGQYVIGPDNELLRVPHLSHVSRRD